jgi:hypothetical protein
MVGRWWRLQGGGWLWLVVADGNRATAGRATAGRTDGGDLTGGRTGGRYAQKSITSKNAIFGACKITPSIIAKKGQKTKRIKRAFPRIFDCAYFN